VDDITEDELTLTARDMGELGSSEEREDNERLAPLNFNEDIAQSYAQDTWEGSYDCYEDA